MGGLDSYIAAADEGMLEAYLSPQREGIPARYLDPQGYWSGISMNVVEILVNIDILARKNLPLPTTWADLANPVYKDEILLSTPSVSGTFYFMVAEILKKFGPENGKRRRQAGA